MSNPFFLQNTIAVIWDFDKTLVPEYMQKPLFDHFNVDERKFWKEVNNLPEFHEKNNLDLISKDTLYLNHILSYVRNDIFKGLNNDMLKSFGKEITFYDGLPEFFNIVKDKIEKNEKYRKHDISLEHYIVSTGLRQIILGSKISEYVDDVWACEFVQNIAPPDYLETGNVESNDVISDIGYVIDNTTKTRAIFEINKGANKYRNIDVNAKIEDDKRRIPIENMIYIADGPSDVPVFSVVNLFGGKTYAVYKPGNQKEFSQVNKLLRENRVQAFGEAIYNEESQTGLWIISSIEEIANKIVRNREESLDKTVGKTPEHITD